MMPDPTECEVRYVCDNMRQASKDEIYLFMPADDPAALADMLLRRPGIGWVQYWNDKPAVLLGAWPMHPGVWCVYGLGTEDYAAALGQVTRHARRVMFPTIRDTGAHRAHAFSLSTATESHKWLRVLGGHEEATLRGYGKNGEDVKVFAWLREKL